MDLDLAQFHDTFFEESFEALDRLLDELLGQQQVVIKSMETNYGPIDGVAGATILGDGAVALILDLPGLIRVASERAAA
jgi:two-component system chemotaxis sensor kinase CheA